jgi:hypothetical protein
MVPIDLRAQSPDVFVSLVGLPDSSGRAVIGLQGLSDGALGVRTSPSRMGPIPIAQEEPELAARPRTAFAHRVVLHRESAPVAAFAEQPGNERLCLCLKNRNPNPHC